MPSLAVILVAAALANFFFFSGRPFGLLAPRGIKPVWVRLAEQSCAFCAFLFVCVMSERVQYGSAYSQGWEFYVVLLCVFLVLSFPGFIYRFFWAH